MPDIKMDSPDDDPVVASYDVFVKPHMVDGKSVYILQFPNQDSGKPYSQGTKSQPLEVRVKDKAGMVEMDVPIDAYRNYDKAKGLQWGEAIKRSTMAKGGGSHGMPGGFGIGGALPTARGRVGEDGDEEVTSAMLEENYDGLVERERILTKQTLGGQVIPKGESAPQYMIGAFRGGKNF